MITIAMKTTGATTTIGAITTIVGGMTIVTATTIDGRIITIATMTKIGTRTIVVMITATTITTPTPTDGSHEATKGSPDKVSTGRKMCAKIDKDHPTTTIEGHATHGPTHHDHKNSTSDNESSAAVPADPII